MVGQAHPRLEGRDKVTGAARYAVEYPAEDVAHAWAVTSSVAKGRITRVDAEAALAAPGVLAVMWYENAPRLCSEEDPELFLLQKPEVAYRGQIVALAVASTLEAAREAAELVHLEYDVQPHYTVLTTDDPGLYAPEKVNPQYATDTAVGDFDAGYAAAAVRVDNTYRTPAYHNNPMEPHATTAQWSADRLTVHDSNQSSSIVQQTLATLFGVPPEKVRVISEHVGGGFGGKGSARCAVVLAALAARRVGRPVRLALTRQQMFAPVGYRTPTIQRIRLGADADVQRPQPRGLPAGGSAALRLGRPRSRLWRAPARPLADRHRGGRVRLPCPISSVHRLGPRPRRRFLPRTDQRDRYRDRRAYRPVADRRRRAGCGTAARDDQYRRLGPAAGQRRRRILGHLIVGLGGEQGVPGAAGADPGPARRHGAGGRRDRTCQHR